MTNLEKKTSFLIKENNLAQSEMAIGMNNPVIGEYVRIFSDKDSKGIIEYFDNNIDELLKVCPHLAFLFLFMAMSQEQRIFEALSKMSEYRDDPRVQANMRESIDEYLEFGNPSANIDSEGDTSPEYFLEKLKDKSQSPLLVITSIGALVANGRNPNDYNRIYMAMLSDPDVSAAVRAQLLTWLQQVNSNIKIMCDFEFVYRNETKRVITIDDDVALEYDPLYIYAEMVMNSIPELTEIVRSGLLNYLTLYHFANYGRVFPYRSQNEMKIFIYTILENLCLSFKTDSSILHVESIPGYSSAIDIKQEIEKFIYYFSTDLR